ncbi:MAG: ABC transporter permease [Vicinamibacterales bacterium]
MNLAGYAARRAIGAVAFMLVVASITFALARLAPGDPLGPDALTMTADEVATLRAELGLDRPWYIQYGRWLAGLPRLDLGRSSLYSRPVAGLVVERAANTAILAVSALLLATLIGIPAGRLAGADRSWPARLVRLVSLVVLSVPPLVASLGLLAIAASTGWLPVGGMTGAGRDDGGWLADLLWHLPLPTLALALPLAATLERVQARAMADAATQPFVGASRARGRTRHDALRLHAWPVSLAPVLGIYGVVVAALFSGSFVVEVVTSWPGLGQLLFDGLRARDVWLVAGCGAAGALFLAVATLGTDLLHAVVDPRTAAESSR